MGNLFLHVLEISIMASYLILVVLFIRACFNKMSASFKCILWLLVGVRLLVPVAISTPFGLVPRVELAQEIENASEQEIGVEYPDTQQKEDAQWEGTGTLGEWSDGTQWGNAQYQGTAGKDDRSDNEGAYAGRWAECYQGAETSGMAGVYTGSADGSSGNKQDTDAVQRGDFGQGAAGNATDMSAFLTEGVLRTLAVCWGLGIVFMLVYMFAGWLRLHRSLRTVVPETVEFAGAQVKIYRTENAGAPFLLGMISPKIYLPYDLSGKELEYVLAHECMHIRRRDYILKPLSFVVLSLYWFHPLVWVSYILLGKDIELACDEQVLRENSSMDRVEYARALLSCNSEQRKIYVCPVAFGESNVKVRVKNVLDYKKPSFWVMFVCVVLCVAVALMFMTVSEDGGDGDYVAVSGEDVTLTEEPIAQPTMEPAAEPTEVPAVTRTDKPTARPTALPTAIPNVTPTPTMIPEDYAPGPIAGFTEAQSKQIREELAERIVYEIEESFQMVYISLDDTDREKGTALSSFFLPEGARIHSVDAVNRIETVTMDGDEWLAVTIVPNLTVGDIIFPAEDKSFDILVHVKRGSDDSIVFGTIYATRNMSDNETGDYYEEQNYTRMHINLLKADVTHDGIEDYIETYMYVAPETDMTVGMDELIQSVMFHEAVYVSVYDGKNATESDYSIPIKTSSYSRVHAGNGQINIVYQEGRAYLMTTSLWAGQGTQSYSYHIYALDAKGRVYEKEKYFDSFYIPDYTLEQRDGFENKFKAAMEPWLEKGILIVGADIDKGQLVSTQRREYTSREYYDWVFEGKYPNVVSTPEPTAEPEEYVQRPIAGFTEAQSKQIRNELQERIKYKMKVNLNHHDMTVWLDSEEYIPGESIGSMSVYRPDGMDFVSLDVANYVEGLEMDGQKWIAVTLMPYVEKDDGVFPYAEEAMELMIPVSIRADGSVQMGEYYPKQYDTQLENSVYVYDAYEEEKYIRIRLNLMQADVTHDGISDNIETFMYFPSEMDMTQDIDALVEWQISVDNVLIQVYDGSTATEDSLGNPVFCSGYSTVHAGNGQLSVVHRDGKDYLLESTLWQGQGSTSYHYNVLALDGAGHQYIIDHAEFSWDSRNEEDTLESLNREIVTFREELSPWMEEGWIVVVTDLGLYPKKEYMITTEKRRYAPREFYDQVLKGVR